MKCEIDEKAENLLVLQDKLCSARHVLLAAVSALLGFGLVLVYSASAARGISFGNPIYFVEKQFVWMCAGLVACTGAYLFNYKWLKGLRIPALVVSVALLAVLLFGGLGTRVNGAQRWFRIGGYSIQPSELAKILMVVSMAGLLSAVGDKLRTFKVSAVLFVLSGLVAALVAIEPDLGTGVLLMTVMTAMIIAAGAKFWHICTFFGIVIPPCAFYVYTHSGYVVERINAWLEGGNTGKAYHAYMSMMSLKSGGTTGMGPGAGWAKLGYVPEAHTDFIFSVAGQEFGIAGTAGIIIAFAVIVGCGIYMLRLIPDSFGRNLCFGIVFMLGLQAAFNIAVVTGAAPTKGISLPFVSFGGSGLVCTLFAVGLLMSVTRHAVRDQIVFLTSNHARTSIGSVLARMITGEAEKAGVISE